MSDAALIADVLSRRAPGVGDRSVWNALKDKYPGLTRNRVRTIWMNAPAAQVAVAGPIDLDLDISALEFHPLANLFPLIEGAEFDELVADIKANGLREPIVLWEGTVLDGRNRYRACMAAEIKPNVAQFRVDIDGDPLAFVISKNLKRRHLNESQRAMVAARIANLPAHRPAADDKSANLRTSQPHAAAMMNISERSLQSAKSVQDKGEPALILAVDRGKLSVSEAAKAARLAPEQQRVIIEKAESGNANAARTVIKQASRDLRETALGARQAAGNLTLPDKRYGVIQGDPQWGRTVYSRATGMDRHAANHYPTANGDEVTQDDAIKALGVAAIAAPDCVLGLWCTESWRGEAVLKAWGFEPKTYFVWVKDIIACEPAENGMLRSGQLLEVVGPAGMGFWNRDRCEIMLIGVRGKPVCPAPGTQGERVWFARRGEHAVTRDDIHSDKPNCSFEWFERHWPNTPKIELNARRARPGWDSWGLDAPPHDPKTGEVTPSTSAQEAAE